MLLSRRGRRYGGTVLCINPADTGIKFSKCMIHRTVPRSPDGLQQTGISPVITMQIGGWLVIQRTVLRINGKFIPQTFAYWMIRKTVPCINAAASFETQRQTAISRKNRHQVTRLTAVFFTFSAVCVRRGFRGRICVPAQGLRPVRVRRRGGRYAVPLRRRNPK